MKGREESPETAEVVPGGSDRALARAISSSGWKIDRPELCGGASGGTVKQTEIREKSEILKWGKRTSAGEVEWEAWEKRARGATFRSGGACFYYDYWRIFIQAFKLLSDGTRRRTMSAFREYAHCTSFSVSGFPLPWE